MKNRTKFYEILVKARTDEVSMILVIGKIMPLIDKYSLNEKNVIDQDLKSILIEYAISVVKEENFAEKIGQIKKLANPQGRMDFAAGASSSL